jgi:hypothetical protein
MKEIKLTQGKIALVDDEDFGYLNQFKWCTYKGGNSYYASRQSEGSHRTRKIIIMHRLIMKTPDNMVVDHIDHNGLNNQKSNMRNCTHAQNLMNQSKNANNPLKYKGVHRSHYKFESCITFNKERIYIGHFDTEELAAIAYNRKAKELFGEFACLNIIDNQRDFIKDKIKTDRAE